MHRGPISTTVYSSELEAEKRSLREQKERICRGAEVQSRGWQQRYAAVRASGGKPFPKAFELVH